MDCKLRAKNCGGCPLLGLDYAAQLKQKEEKVRALLGKYGPVHPIRGMEQPYHYRNKVISTFTTGWGGKLTSGIYAANSHKVLPVERCLLQDEVLDKTMQAVRAAANACRYQPYDEDKGTGLVRHCLLRRGVATGQVMVVLVTASPVFPSKNNFVKALRAAHPEITTVVQNINGRGTSMVLGEKEHVLYGPGFIVDELCGFRFRISSRSFYQINPVQTEKLYRLAIQAAGLTGKETVIDAYCGIGTIGIAVSPEAKEVIGVELNPDAVRDAVTNAKVNGVKNIRFYCNDAGKFMVQMASQGGKADVVFMDPPRSGSTEEFINAVATLKPARVVYVSCGPDTLARDLAVFKRKGYEAKEAWGVDMFPFTGHVETVVLLSKLNTKQHIEVELNLDELDLTSAESKATYEEIKTYVLEHTGLKVSHLYIAQVKQKYGIIERENYNKPKSVNSRQPKCPSEKEAAITEALKHFGMI